jgi:hypothetical protein
VRRLLPVLASLLVAACVTKLPSPPCTAVGSFPGPEDFDDVELEGQPALVVSAAARRDGQTQAENGFWLVDPTTQATRKLAIHGRDACPLAPHGIATVEPEPGRWELWAILHYQPEGCEGQAHGIERYRLEADGLHFAERLLGPELRNPNDLDVLDGRLWLSDNPSWEEGKGFVGDMLLRRPKGRILHWDPQRATFSVATEDLLYPNGVAVIGDRLWVGAAYGRLYHFELHEDGSAGERVELRVEPKAALDNLMEHEGSLWVTGHPKGLAFIKHRKRASANAPTVAYRVSLASEAVEAVADWREGQVNAGSTVWPLGEQLVLAQVFDPGLRLCSLPE